MQEFERLAEQFLAGVPGYIWDGETLPIPIEDIADTHVGLLVRDIDDLAAAPGAPLLDSGQSLSGLLLPTIGEIWVNAGEARQWPPRRRFTIAHELGHWCLHRDAERNVFCRSGTIAPDTPPQRPPLPPREEQANAFAAALLMPAHLVREQFVRCEGDPARLREAFSASDAAMRRRLQAIIGA